jgi:uncharacterized protein with HEPN domain
MNDPADSSSGKKAASAPVSQGEPTAALSGDVYVASMLANFFEAGWSVQVLVGDADQAQYEASRLARPEAEKHLSHMAAIAGTLPEAVRELMPKVDWQSWAELGDYLPPKDAHARALVWTVIHAWLPPHGQALRRYRRQLPQLWRFKL